MCIPEYDGYCFGKLKDAADMVGNSATDAITTSNAYASLLTGMERLGDMNVPTHIFIGHTRSNAA